MPIMKITKRKEQALYEGQKIYIYRGVDSELPKGKSCIKRNGQYANCLRANSALCATDNAIREYEEDK